MNEIDKTHTPPPTADVNQPPPVNGSTITGAPPQYDTDGVPSPKVEKGDAPPIDHEPDGDVDLLAALDLSGSMAGSAEFDVFQIMDVMEKSMIENQKVAEDDALEAALQVATKLKSAAKAIRSAAKFALAAGIAMGSMQIVAGAASIGGAVKSTRTLSVSDEVNPELVESTESETSESQTPETESSSVTEPTMEETPESGETNQPQEEDNINEDIEKQEQKLQETVEKAAEGPNTTSDEGTMLSDDAAADKDMDEKAAEQKKLQSKNQGGGNLMTYQKASNITTFAQGLSQVVQGTGQVISTVLKYYSDEKQAESKDIEAQSSEARSLAEQKKAFAESVQRDADKIFDQMQQLMQSSYETTETITRV